MRAYVVKQGDHLAKLAFLLGFSADEVWNDPKNAELKAARPDPDLLAPGDVLYIPDASPENMAVQGGTSNDYAASVPEVTIHLVFSDSNAPLAGEVCVIEGVGEPELATTDDGGKLTITAPITLREIRVTLPARDLAYAVRVGDLDPIAELSGVRQRLQHLGFEGYEPWTRNEGADIETDEGRRAIAAFQRASGLSETGEADDDTRSALVAAHGS